MLEVYDGKSMPGKYTPVTCLGQPAALSRVGVPVSPPGRGAAPQAVVSENCEGLHRACGRAESPSDCPLPPTCSGTGLEMCARSYPTFIRPLKSEVHRNPRDTCTSTHALTLAGTRTRVGCRTHCRRCAGACTHRRRQASGHAHAATGLWSGNTARPSRKDPCLHYTPRPLLPAAVASGTRLEVRGGKQ